MTDQDPTVGYASKNVAELQELARERDLAGRSSMNREELVAALTAADMVPPVAPSTVRGDDSGFATPASISASQDAGSFKPATKSTPITARATGEAQ